MQPPRAILFDLDGTLVSEGQSRRDFLNELTLAHAELFSPLTPLEAADRLEAQFEDFWADGARHKHWRKQPRLEARKYIAEQAFARLRADGAARADAAAAHAFAERFHTIREAQVNTVEGAHDVLGELRRRGVRLALVTNGPSESQRRTIARFDLAGYFDHIQIEGEHGFGKPEDQAYVHALRQLGAAPHETWMVGDNLEWEVAAPQRHGMRGLWCDYLGIGLPAGSDVKPDRILRQLPEVLWEG